MISGLFQASNTTCENARSPLGADNGLNATEGMKSLMSRLRGAARRVCSPAPSRSGELKSQQDYQRCLDGAVGGAVEKTGDPRVKSAYDQR